MFVSGWVRRVGVLVFMAAWSLGAMAQSPAASVGVTPAAFPSAANAAPASGGSVALPELAVAENGGREILPGTKAVVASASPAQTLQQQIAALPSLTNLGVAADVDVDRRGQEILAHLNAVLRYYRGVTAAPLQKVGEPSDVLYSEQALTQTTDAARTAFQSARNEAALLLKLQKGSKAGGPPAIGANGLGTAAQGGNPGAENIESAPPQTEAQHG